MGAGNAHKIRVCLDIDERWRTWREDSMAVSLSAILDPTVLMLRRFLRPLILCPNICPSANASD